MAPFIFPIWKRIKCLSSTQGQRNLKTQQSPQAQLPAAVRERSPRSSPELEPTITGNFGSVFEKNSGSEITCIGLSRGHRFRKAAFFQCFPSTLKRKADVFKFLQFEKHFPKAPFSWRTSVDGRPNRRNKAKVLSNFSRVMWRGRNWCCWWCFQGTREWLNEHLRIIGRAGSSKKKPPSIRVSSGRW